MTLRVCKETISRKFTIRAQSTGQIRTAEYEGREHIVVPVIALMEGVVWPVNAPAPELVLAEELSKAPAGWNGRPVMMDHPDMDGVKVSANSPEVLEKFCFGQVFLTRFNGETKKLHMEAWLDPVKAAKVGSDAEDVILRAQEGKQIEVSVGSFITLEDVKGTYGPNQQSYQGIWRDIVPDHLAMLPRGTKGACSNEMGCGVRSASGRIHVLEGKDIVVEGDAMTVAARSLRDRIKALITGGFLAREASDASVDTRADAFLESAPQIYASSTGERILRKKGELSDMELRGKIDDALRAVEPGYLWVDDVFPQSKEVIYMTAPEDKLLYYRRSFTVNDGEVSLGDDRVEGDLVTQFQPKNAASGEPRANSGKCGCGGAPTTAQEERAMKTIAERVDALLASGKTKFTEAHKPTLLAMSAEAFTALEETAGITATASAAPSTPAPAAPAAPAVAPAAPAAAPVAAAAAAPAPQTEEEWLKSAPQSVRDLVSRAATQEKAQKDGLVSKLKTAQKIYTEEELNGMSVESLTKLAALAKVEQTGNVIDFGTRQVGPRTAADAEAIPAAPSLVDGIRAAAGQKS